MGVLYAGFCTAVLFGKVIRSQSQAQIFFSDPMVVRFGVQELNPLNNVYTENNNESQGRMDSDVEVGDTTTTALPSIEESKVKPMRDVDTNIPCPSLEFRLVNRLHDIDEGEIGECTTCCKRFGWTHNFSSYFA